MRFQWNDAETNGRTRPDEIIGKHFSIFYTAEDRASGKPEWELERAAAQS